MWKTCVKFFLYICMRVTWKNTSVFEYSITIVFNGFYSQEWNAINGTTQRGILPSWFLNYYIDDIIVVTNKSDIGSKLI